MTLPHRIAQQKFVRVPAVWFAAGALCLGSLVYALLRFPLHASHWLQGAAELSSWIACAVVLSMLGKLAWNLRGHMPFRITVCGLTMVTLAFGVKRLLDLGHARLAATKTDAPLASSAPLVALLAALGFVLLLPFLRRTINDKVAAESSEERFRTAANLNPLPFCLLESTRSPLRSALDFQFTFANDAALKLLRLAPEELVGRTLTSLFPHIRESGVLDRLKEVLQTHLPYSGEVKDTTPEGVALWFNVKASRLQDGLALALSDLREEQQRQKHIDDLNRFSQSIIQDAPFSIVATNAMGIITAMNSATEQLTGYRRHELIGKHSLVILHDPAELSGRAIELTQSMGEDVIAGFHTLTTSLKRRKSNESEWTYIRTDGRKVAVHLAMTVLRGTGQEVTGYLAVAFDISERKKLNDSISFLAHHDSLTKLPNRMLLNERMLQAIERAKAMDQHVAIFMVDIDQFKRINDSLGHWGGDQLLVEVSERLLTAVRKTDTVARVGGDEFILLMPNSGTVDDAYMCATRILSKLQPAMTIAGREVSMTASVGFCIYPDWGGDPVSLLRNADAAMYAAKRRGRGTFQAFSGSMLEASTDKLELEADLRHAVKNGQMYVAYQPQVECRTGEIVGVEALLRWKHPTRGNVTPVEFIPIAEECGLILPIGQWALQQACVEIKRLQERTGRRLTLAANLSPRQFQQPGLSAIVETILTESGLAADDLEIEITESTLMVTSADTMEGLSRMRELGVRIAIDDFGTGFSNFQYILDYKADRLKIDRSFIAKCPQDPTANSVVRSVIAMAHGLNMKVVAEGVETEEQLAFLCRKRCDEAQGFLLGRPIPIEDLMKVVREWKPSHALSISGTAAYTGMLTASSDRRLSTKTM